MTRLSRILASKLGFRPPANVSAIQIILRLAVNEIATVFTPDRFEEEPITAALSAGIASHSRWVLPLFGAGADARCIAWGHYRKHKKTSASEDAREEDVNVSAHGVTEADTGADFALLLRVEPEYALLGVFQSKIRKRENVDPNDPRFLTVNFHQRGKGKSRPPQMITLETFGKKVIEKLQILRSGDSINIEKADADLNWIHYLIYRDGPPFLVSMSDLQTVRELARGEQTSRTSHVVTLNAEKFKSFARTVDLRKMTRDQSGRPKLDGWLTLSKLESEKLLPDLYDLTNADICVADETKSSGGVGLQPDEGHIADVITLSAQTNDPLMAFFEQSINFPKAVQQAILKELLPSPPAPDGPSDPRGPRPSRSGKVR